MGTCLSGELVSAVVKLFSLILGALSHFCLNPGSQLSHSFCSSSPGDFSMLFHFSQIDITGAKAVLTTLQVVKTACDFLGKQRTSSVCVSGICIPITGRSVP